jgi:hypothetical protein
MPKREDGDVKIFNPHTGAYEPAKDDQKFAVEMHEAIAAGKALPSDRTLEDLRNLEPGVSGPTLTAGPVAASPASAAGGAASVPATPPSGGRSS